jgi:hypothetical protein
MFYLMSSIRGEAASPCHVCVASTVFELPPREEHIFCGVIGRILPVPVTSCSILGPDLEDDDEPAPCLFLESTP